VTGPEAQAPIISLRVLFPLCRCSAPVCGTTKTTPTPYEMRRPDGYLQARWWWALSETREQGAGLIPALHAALDLSFFFPVPRFSLPVGWAPWPACALGVNACPLATFQTASSRSTRRQPPRPSCSRLPPTLPSAKPPRRFGLYYAPDPFEGQIACTIGGNPWQRTHGGVPPA